MDKHTFLERFIVCSLILLGVFTIGVSSAQDVNLKTIAIKIFNNKKLDKKYRIDSFLAPSFLQADFNGDKAIDVAVPITEISSGKKGLLVVHSKTDQYFVFGAGHIFGNGGDNFKWVDKWSIFKGKIAYETVFDKNSGDIIDGKKMKLLHPAVEIINIEQGSGGLIYWDGKKYIWVHQGQ